MAVKTNDLKKGTRVHLANGWYATILDNARGNIRMMDVEGMYREIGSVYAWDITKAQVNGTWQSVELTEKQVKARHSSNVFGF